MSPPHNPVSKFAALPMQGQVDQRPLQVKLQITLQVSRQDPACSYLLPALSNIIIMDSSTGVIKRKVDLYLTEKG
jgi:hypothetical protein